MAMCRTFQTMSPFNATVVLVAVGLLLCFLAYIFEFLLFFNPTFTNYVIPIEIIFFILMYWTFLKVYLTEPGSVPKFYAVSSQNYSRNEQRKYCLSCHNFKPQRAHHCSACKKCILNMDHHCPWINNCVGFYNRKFFILFLFYLVVNIVFVLPQQIYLIVLQLIPIFNHQSTTTIHTCIRLIVIIFQIGILLPITTFMGYHMTLVFQNQTTLSQMKKEKQQEKGIKPPEYNVYNLGDYRNFVQVFGKRYWEWFLPITGTLTCDGLHWPKNYRYQPV